MGVKILKNAQMRPSSVHSGQIKQDEVGEFRTSFQGSLNNDNE